MVLETAVIIAGGRGMRLEERTDDLPKPMIPVAGEPIISRIVNWLKGEGVLNMVIGVAYKKEKIIDFLGDGKERGVNIRYTVHDEKGGTEDAFKAAIEQSGIQDNNFYAMNGDQLTDMQLRGLTNSHLTSNAVATIVTIKLRTNFGIIDIDNENRIIGFQEKNTISNILINSGIYIFNKGIRDYLTGGNIEENAFRKLIEDKKIRSFYYDGLWLPINDKKEFKRAEEYLRKFENLRHH